MQRDYLGDILYYIGCMFCGWIIQRMIMDDITIYVPLFGWVFSKMQTVVLYYILLVGNLVIFMISKDREMDLYSLLMIAGFPMQMFLVMLYSNYLVKILVAALVLFVLYTVWILARICKARYKAYLFGKGYRMGSALRRALGKLHWNGGLILCLVALYISVGPIKDKTLWTPGETAGIKGESHMELIRDVEGALWDNNQEGLKNLRQEIFETLTVEEKVESLQFILDLELTYLGCDAVQLVAQEFEDPGLMGYYNHEKKIVSLNKNLLDMTSSACIEVCLHEAYHAYQYACIESIDWKHADTGLRMYKDIANWKYEFEHYSSASGWSTWNEYERYADQEVERTAREYAEEWCRHYIIYIEKMELVP